MPVGITPQGVSVTPDGAKVYVANAGSNTVSVIDTASYAVKDVSVGAAPEGVSVTPDGTLVYVANSNSNTVSVINTTTDTVTDNVSVGDYPTSFPGQFIQFFLPSFFWCKSLFIQTIACKCICRNLDDI